MASALVGSGTQLALPILVLRHLGVTGVGFYGAAATIAQGYIGLLLNTLGQDYFPRVAADARRPAALVGLVNEQHRILMLLSAPMILGLMALARQVIVLVYSPEFLPALELLEWQLVADLVRFSAWTMSFVVLARSGSARNLVERHWGTLMIVEPDVVAYVKMRWLDGPLPVTGADDLGLGYFLLAVEEVREDAAAEWEGGMRMTQAIEYRPVPTLAETWAQATLAALAAPRARA